MVTLSTNRLKLDGVGPVDNRPSTNKDGGLEQLQAAGVWLYCNCRQTVTDDRLTYCNC